MTPEEASVLVIEDDPNNLILITELLSLMRVGKISSGKSGQEGIERALSEPQIDLVLLDIQLPNEDGYTILRQLRGIPKLSRTRIVAVTANVLQHDIQRARAAGFDGFIGKPINFHLFPSQIQGLLKGEKVWTVH